MTLRDGEKAPNFQLQTSDGEAFELSQLDGEWKIIFFFAKSGSPTCKRGCLSFKEQYELFRSLEPPVEVIGISQDTVEQQKNSRMRICRSTFCRINRDVSDVYGVPLHLGMFHQNHLS